MVGVPVAFSAAFAFVVVLAFAFALAFDIFADIKRVAAARRIFGGHVTILVE